MKPPTVFLISFQIPMMEFRKSSFVFHRCINAATRATIAATIPAIARVGPPIATFRAVSIVFIFLKAFTTFFTILMAFDTPRISGPIAAATPAIVIMVFFVSSSALAKAVAHS